MSLRGPSLALTAILALAPPGVLVEAAASSSQQAVTRLRIAVLEGEDAVNIVQQKTAVAPLIEVRDQNGLPVPGVTVVFRIASGGATFPGGGTTLSVTTNAAGRALAAGLTPGAPGAVNISAAATFQGHTAAVSISQSNFATAMAAANAAGGGISGTTLAIIGAAVGGGAAVAVQAKSNDAPTGTATATTPPATSATTPTVPTPPPTATPPPVVTPPQEAPVTAVYNGQLSGTYSSTSNSSDGSSCTTRFSVSGSVSVSAELRGDALTGNFLEMVLQFQETAHCVGQVGPIAAIPGATMSSYIMRPTLVAPNEGPFALETNGPVSGGAAWRFAQEKTEFETSTGGSHNVTVNTALRRTIDVTAELTKEGGPATLSIAHRTDMTWNVDPGSASADGSGRFSFTMTRIR